MSINPRTHITMLDGPAGPIEVAVDTPEDAAPRGIALIGHPHPLFGGTMDNKVAQTLARAALALGFTSLRPNFRGVGKTAGEHDQGRGEVDDMLAVLEAFASHAGPRLLAGFSFGAFVQTQVSERLIAAGTPAERLVLVGTPAGKWPVGPVPSDTLVIHGEHDETIPLAAVLDWARPQELPVVVVPGADHFFHRRLPVIKRLVVHALSVAHEVDAA